MSERDQMACVYAFESFPNWPCGDKVICRWIKHIALLVLITQSRGTSANRLDGHSPRTGHGCWAECSCRLPIQHWYRQRAQSRRCFHPDHLVMQFDAAGQDGHATSEEVEERGRSGCIHLAIRVS